MKITTIAFALVTVIILFPACQKDYDAGVTLPPLPTDTSANSNSYKVKTYTEDYSTPAGREVVTYNVSYDEKGRLSSAVSTTSPGDKFVYGYTPDSYTLDIYNAGQISIHVVYFINSLSLIDSSLQYNDTKDTSSEKYIYNAGRQLIRLQEYQHVAGMGAILSNVHHYDYDNKGNLLKDSTNNSLERYEYYDNLFNNLSIGLDIRPRNKNLVKTTISDGGTVSHTYTFDNLNRLTSEKEVFSTGEVAIRTYTY